MQPDFRNTAAEVSIDLFFPKPDDLPSICLQGLVHLLVTFNVSFQLFDPKTLIACGDPALQVVLAVPEGTVAEDCHFLALETDIWCTED